MKPIFTVVKRNFLSSLVAFIITLFIIIVATTSKDANISISRGNYSWLYLIMLPFFVVFANFKKFINLNISKSVYYKGSIATYFLSSLIVSLFNTIIHIAVDPLNKTQNVINLMELCGWWSNGVIIAFIQQFLFLFLCTVFFHILLSMQNHWYGWIIDIILVLIICIFIPIEPLRNILVSFFKLIMFNSTAWLHILVCIVFSILLYFIGILILKSKSI